MCNSVEHIKTNCPRNGEIGKDSREDGTVKDRVPEERSETISSSEESPMDEVAVQPDTGSEVSAIIDLSKCDLVSQEDISTESSMHKGNEDVSRGVNAEQFEVESRLKEVAKKFVATKRGLSASPEQQNKKSHEDKRKQKEDRRTLDEIGW